MRRWLPAAICALGALAVWAPAYAAGHGMVMLWVPAVLVGAAWPRRAVGGRGAAQCDGFRPR